MIDNDDFVFAVKKNRGVQIKTDVNLIQGIFVPAQVLRGSSLWLYIRSHDIIRECHTRTNPTGWEISQQYHENEDQPLVRVKKTGPTVDWN